VAIASDFLIIPAQAGIQWAAVQQMRSLDSRLRGNDEVRE